MEGGQGLGSETVTPFAPPGGSPSRARPQRSMCARPAWGCSWATWGSSWMPSWAPWGGARLPCAWPSSSCIGVWRSASHRTSTRWAGRSHWADGETEAGEGRSLSGSCGEAGRQTLGCRAEVLCGPSLEPGFRALDLGHIAPHFLFTDGETEAQRGKEPWPPISQLGCLLSLAQSRLRSGLQTGTRLALHPTLLGSRWGRQQRC